MSEVLFRCSSVGKLMTEPKTLKEGPLSVGAKTWIRELVAQEIFGVDFEISGRELEKGIQCEPDSIALLNRVRGTALQKNAERRADAFFSGECDLFNAAVRRGHDLKTSWSLKTFPIALADCKDKIYEYQMRAYMRLWNADSWSVDYCMVNTPENLVGYEPLSMHFVDHIPERMRITSWVVERDLEIEAAMVEKVKHARAYYAEVIAEFDRTHSSSVPTAAAAATPGAPEPVPEAKVAPQPTAGPTPLYWPLAATEVAPAPAISFTIPEPADQLIGIRDTTGQIVERVSKREFAERYDTAEPPAAAETLPPLSIGELSARFGFTVSAALIQGTLGFEPVESKGRAVLFRASTWPRIKSALIAYIEGLA